ncbi:hypothetical protein CFP56_025900 [Quercus suber]|uniref:Reverse transcriptase zinc-binding domain-containing protein n=1 Tax=Quercus suber TaxID=58331 RepID=A0AAW0LZF1_QUESU
MTEKATWKNSDRSTSSEKGGVDLRNAKNKEIRDPGEQITLKGREYGSPLNEVPISNSNLTAFHTGNVAFEMQIQELDLEISKFDKGDAHVEHTSVGVSQAPPTNEKQVAPSMQTFEPLDQPHHVTESSTSSNQGTPDEADLVLSIPLSRTPVEDKIIWPFTSSVWHFLWRVGKDAVPTKQNLMRRKILMEDKCEQCGVETEMAIHAVWECAKLDEIWEAVP